jgi:hypothetical protein
MLLERNGVSLLLGIVRMVTSPLLKVLFKEIFVAISTDAQELRLCGS